MATGDKVKATRGHLITGDGPIAVYEVDVGPDGVYVSDVNGVSQVKFAGGVKTGSIGFIDGNPAKTLKSYLRGYEKTPSLGGYDTVLLYPVYFEEYKRVAWIPADHFQILG